MQTPHQTYVMTEFKNGIFQLLARTSIGRSIIYTIGHIIIAMTSNMIITGAALNLALADAIIEPLVNGVWYFILDKTWSKYDK